MAQSSIKEVNTRVNFDSEFCGSIPINFVNMVQSHGVLMTLEKGTLKIVQISENCKDLLNIPHLDILNKNLGNFIPDQFEEIKDKFEKLSAKDQIPLSINFLTGTSSISLTATLHNKERYLLLEIEKEKPIEHNLTFTHLHQRIKFILVKLKDAGTVEELAKIAAAEIKSLSGFDRVMIYKFDQDWNGSAIGESKEDDMEPYLNLRFPASDVPKQARELYLRNPYRLIPDISSKPSRLFPVVNPLTHHFTDLADCNLRSAPSVHLEYLKNMNVTTSMSTPIIKENKLWGLISCHHKTPKIPSYEMISSFELISGILSSEITAWENEKALKNKTKLLEINGKILERLYQDNSIANCLFRQEPNILELLSLGGAAIMYNGRIETYGRTPNESSIQLLVKWLERRVLDKVFYSDNLAKIYHDGEAIHDTASGLIAIPINKVKNDYILGFRPEVIFEVDWGGNPYEAINMESDGKNYHPRNSFSLWKEIVKRTSKVWSVEQVEAAESLRTNVLQKIVSASMR